ncbi:hypothetical protein [Deinococcus multiflagellatus]|uniref:Uncharacterized protein n=1 Tax=Deinococcus multiflagellatus TaxID=1656887 RepID=A0ABW1ZSM4_9DEIO
MLTLPAARATQPWHLQRHIRQAVLNVFRYCSGKLSYTLLLKPGEGLAWVAPERRLVYITASLPDVPPGVRFDPVGEDLRRSLFLVGFAAHEAGHVRFSGAKPSGTLGELWNALEDERMERLMVEAYPELRLRHAFTFLGDVVSAGAQAKFEGTALEGCLFWRWEHDRVYPRWQVDPAQAELWADVRPLVEAAWQARDSDQVTWIAQQILGLVRGDQASPSGADTGSPDAEEQSPGSSEALEAAGTAGGQETPETGGDEAATGPASGDSADEGDKVAVPESWAGQVSATGAGAAAQDGTTPDPEADAELQAQLEVLRRQLGAGSDSCPIIPAPNVDTASDLLAAGVEGHARQLAPLLRPAERAGHTTAHRSRGRFRYDRHVQGAERAFARKTEPTRPQPIFLDLLLDVSTSMAGEPLACAAQGPSSSRARPT